MQEVKDGLKGGGGGCVGAIEEVGDEKCIRRGGWVRHVVVVGGGEGSLSASDCGH